MAEEQKYASFDPDLAESTGMFDEGDFEFVGPRIAFYEYPNGGKAVGLLTTLKQIGGDGLELENQFWKCGDEQRTVPSGDGERIIFVGSSTVLNKKSNFVKLMASLKNAGVPVAKYLDGSAISNLNGLKAHLVRSVNPDAPKSDDGKDRKVVLATKLIALPGEKKGSGGSKPAAQNAPAPETAGGGDNPLNERTALYLVQALNKNGGKLPMNKIAAAVYQAATAAKDNDKVAISKLSFAQEFLTNQSGSPVQIGDEIVAFEYDAAAKEVKIAA